MRARSAKSRKRQQKVFRRPGLAFEGAGAIRYRRSGISASCCFCKFVSISKQFLRWGVYCICPVSLHGSLNAVADYLDRRAQRRLPVFKLNLLTNCCQQIISLQFELRTGWMRTARKTQFPIRMKLSFAHDTTMPPSALNFLIRGKTHFGDIDLFAATVGTECGAE